MMLKTILSHATADSNQSVSQVNVYLKIEQHAWRVGAGYVNLLPSDCVHTNYPNYITDRNTMKKSLQLII